MRAGRAGAAGGRAPPWPGGLEGGGTVACGGGGIFLAGTEPTNQRQKGKARR